MGHLGDKTTFLFIAGLFATTGFAQQDIDLISLDSLLNIKINTATKYDQTVREAPTSVTIITTDDIQRYGYRTLAEVLNSVRGYYISDDRNYQYLGVRGFSRPTDYNNRILVLFNGHTLNENIYGSAPIGRDLAVDLGIIERIEILRGPASALYGTSAMFTVINIVTKRGNTMAGFQTNVEAGSFGKYKGSIAFGRKYNNGVDFSITGIWGSREGQELYFKEYNDPETNNGIAEKLDWHEYQGFHTTVRYKGFQIQGFLSSSTIGIPTGSYGIAFNNNKAKTADNYSFIELKYDCDLSFNKNIIVRAYIDRYKYAGVFPYDYEDYISKWEETSCGNKIGSEFQFRWDMLPNDRFISGLEFQRNIRADYKAWDEDTVYYDKDFPFNIASLYIQNEYQALENLAVILGIRSDIYTTYGSSITPRAAVIYHPRLNSTFKFLYGEAFRAPNIYEVYYESDDEATGNPDLEPEMVNTLETIWEQKINDYLFTSASLFQYHAKDLIDPIIDPLDSLEQYRNFSGAIARGLEFELKMHRMSGLRGYINYMFQNTKGVDTDLVLTNSPTNVLKAGLSYPFYSYLNVSLELRYESERITVLQTETGPYLLTALHLSTKPVFNHFRMSLLIRNLFDVMYALPGGYEHITPIASEDMPSIIQDGRNFTFRLEYRF